jgi:hypothetical protein
VSHIGHDLRLFALADSPTELRVNHGDQVLLGTCVGQERVAVDEAAETVHCNEVRSLGVTGYAHVGRLTLGATIDVTSKIMQRGTSA